MIHSGDTTNGETLNAWIAVAAGAIAASLFNVYPVLVDALIARHSFSELQIGWLVGVELAGIGVASVYSAFGPPTKHPRRLAIVAVLIVVIGNAISATLHDFISLCSMRFLVGVGGEGVLYALCASLAGQSRRPERIFALVTLTQVTYAVLGLWLMPLAVVRWDLYGVMIPLAVFALLCLPLVARLGELKKIALAEIKEVDADRWPAVACGVAVLIWHIGIGGFWVFTYAFAQDSGLDAIRAGQALAIGMAAGIAGGLVPALLSLRAGRALPFVVAMAAQLASLVAIHFATGWGTFLLAIVLWNVSWNLALPYILGLFAETDRDNRLIRLSPAAQGFGLSIGPPVAGLIVTAWGHAGVLWVYALTIAIAAALYLGVLVVMDSRLGSPQHV